METPIRAFIFAAALAPLAATQAARADAGFETLERTSAGTMAGLSVNYSAYDIPEGSADVTPLRYDLYLSAMLSDDFGMHGQMLMSYVSIDPPPSVDDESQSESSLWGVVIGGHYLARWDRGEAPLSVSLALPTAPNGPGETIARIITVYSRVQDMVTLAPETTWLRLGASPRLRSGVFELQADIGLDLPVAGENDPDPLVRLGLGASVDLADAVALMLESSNVLNPKRLDDDGEAAVNTVTLGARYIGSAAQPGLHITMPLDDDAMDDLVVYHFSLRGQLGD